MATAFKVFGEAALAATTNTVVCTIPADTDAVLNIRICNRTSGPINIRLAFSVADTPTDAEWVEYDTEIEPGTPLNLTGDCLEAGRRVVGYASDAGISITVNGQERG